MQLKLCEMILTHKGNTVTSELLPHHCSVWQVNNVKKGELSRSLNDVTILLNITAPKHLLHPPALIKLAGIVY